MQPILFATNYTAASENAGNYAAQLAKQLSANLVVMHSWTVPVVAAEGIAVTPDPEEYRRSEKIRVDKETDRLHREWNIPVEGIAVNGFGPDEVKAAAANNEAGLVVMGTHHHTLFSRLSGSVATALFHHAGFPLLLVPEHGSFSAPKTLLLASDGKNVPALRALSILKSLNHQLNTKLEIVNVQHPGHIWNLSSTPETIRLEHSLRFVDHSWHYELNSDTTEGIRHAAKEVKADWIVVAPRHFGWLEDIFRRSTTEKLAFSCDKPLLILPADNN